MKHTLRLLIIAAAAGAASGANADVASGQFSPLADGYISRARSMSAEGNYAGVIDQISHLRTQGVLLSATEDEECAWLLARACYERGDAQCVRLLTDFMASYPASRYAPGAATLLGDYYFFDHQWALALEAYERLDLSRLNPEERTLYTYRKALSLIRTGHYDEARPLIAQLRDAAAYRDAYNFYTGYLDYIAGDYDRAWKYFEKVTPSVPGLEVGYYMTQIEFLRGQYENVISHGTSLLRKNPVEELAPELQRIVGLSYFHQGELNVAEGYLNNYLLSTPADPEADALYAKGAIDYAQGRYAEAVKYLSKVTDRPDAISQGAWLYLGQCYLKQDNPASAAIAFEKASRLDYDRNVTETALYNYVTALTRGGKLPFSSSSDLLEKFVARYPDSEFTPEVEAYLATAYFNDRNFTKALRYIDAIKRPTAANLELKQKVLYELGVEAATNGQSDAASRYLKQCTQLRTSDTALTTQAQLWLGDALFQLGRYTEARVAYSEFLRAGKSTPNRALGYYNLGYTEYKLENYRAAAAAFQSALTASPALASNMADDAMLRRADCLYYLGDYSGAAALFSRAIENGATDSDYALYRRAVIRGLSGDTSAKLADLAETERQFPDSRWMSRILLEQAVTYEEKGRSDKAADAYRKRLNTSANVDIDELLRMAAAMSSAARWSDLLDVVERIRRAGGLEADEVADIDLYEADALLNTGRTADATEIYERLAQNPTSLPGAQSVVALAEREVAAGNFEAARVRMEDFTDTGTPHQYWLARGFITLADAYNGLGQKPLAREYLTSLRENYPGGNDDIADRIATRLKKWR